MASLSEMAASSPQAFVAINAVASIVPLPLAAVLAGVAGATYGVVLGTFIYVLSAVLGAVGSMLIGRVLLRPAAVLFLTRVGYADKVAAFDAAIVKNGPFTLVFLLRLSPVFPYAVTSLILSLCDVSVRDYSLATFAGLIPSSFVYILLGDSSSKAAGGGMSSTDFVITLASLVITVMVTIRVVKVANATLNSSLGESKFVDGANQLKDV